MTDWRDLALDPDPAFRQRLEDDLLRALGVVANHAGAQVPGHAEKETTVEIDLDERTTEPRTKHRRRLGWAVAAGLVAVVAGAVALASRDDGAIEPAVASSGGDGEVTFDVQWPDFLATGSSEACVEDPEGRYSSADSARCFREFLGEATFTGDVAGNAMWSMMANLGASTDGDATVDLPRGFGVTYIVDAEVAGCGTGEFMISSAITFLGWEAGGLVGDWQIIPGSGRFELASIAGSGQVVAQEPGPDFGAIANGPRTHVGTITC